MDIYKIEDMSVALRTDAGGFLTTAVERPGVTEGLGYMPMSQSE